jgi:hypothetical protein
VNDQFDAHVISRAELAEDYGKNGRIFRFVHNSTLKSFTHRQVHLWRSLENAAEDASSSATSCEGSNSSNVGLSSVELAQAQFHLAGCLRRLSTRANEGTMSPEIPEDPKHRLNAALELYELCTTTMAQELAFINDEDENALQLAVDLASAYNDWGVGLWQRGNHGDAEAAVLCFSRALQMRRVHRGVVLMC